MQLNTICWSTGHVDCSSNYQLRKCWTLHRPAPSQQLHTAPAPTTEGIIEPFYLWLPSWINMGIVNCCVGQGFWIHDLFFFTLVLRFYYKLVQSSRTSIESNEHGIMGRRFPNGGLLSYRKWVPQQLGDVIVVTNSPPTGHMRSQLTNHQVGIVLAVGSVLAME